MNEKLVTLVVLPYSKAHIFKMRLEAKGIKCQLEDVHLIEGSTSNTVRVKVLEEDVPDAFPELDAILGLKPEEKQEEKRQILVPIDFSQVSLKSAQMAANIALHLDAQLIVMHCYISPVKFAIPFGEIYPYDSSLLIQTQVAEQNANVGFSNFINELVQLVGIDNWESLKPEYIVKPGYASEDILAYAKEHHPRLIVIGQGGDKSWPGTVGSVTADIMYNAPVPVLVIPEEMKNKSVEAFRNVLYATDFDAQDFAALDKLMFLLRHFEMNVTCAHVGNADAYGWDLARLEGMKEILQNKHDNKRIDCKLLMGKDVLQTLESYLEDEDIDLLALTTHKRNMLSRLFNPSLARRMVFHTHIPLLVFHA